MKAVGSLDALAKLIPDMSLFSHTKEHHLPALIKATLVNVQFETIHPFLDGNGRLGRALITMLLCADQALVQPILYLSLYLKQHRQVYYDLLQEVRTKGDWEAWCEFFLDGVTETALQASADAKRILDLLERDRSRIGSIGRASQSALKIHAYLLKKPFLSITKAAKTLKLSVPTTTNAVQKLVDLGLLKELTGQARNRLFAYADYLAILTAGTEPLKR